MMVAMFPGQQCALRTMGSFFGFYDRSLVSDGSYFRMLLGCMGAMHFIGAEHIANWRYWVAITHSKSGTTSKLPKPPTGVYRCIYRDSMFPDTNFLLKSDLAILGVCSDHRSKPHASIYPLWADWRCARLKFF